MCVCSFQSPSLRHFTTSETLRTYENRSNNHTRSLNKVAPKRLRYSHDRQTLLHHSNCLKCDLFFRRPEIKTLQLFKTTQKYGKSDCISAFSSCLCVVVGFFLPALIWKTEDLFQYWNYFNTLILFFLWQNLTKIDLNVGYKSDLFNTSSYSLFFLFSVHRIPFPNPVYIKKQTNKSKNNFICLKLFSLKHIRVTLQVIVSLIKSTVH